MQTKIKDPAFLAEYDASEVDCSRHPELYACDWLEQIGSYLKYGLLLSMRRLARRHLNLDQSVMESARAA